MRYHLQAVLILLVAAVGGCGLYDGVLDGMGKAVAESMEQDVHLLWSMVAYNCVKGEWPSNADELITFCGEQEEMCVEVDWERYRDIYIEPLDDGRAKISFRTIDSPPGSEIRSSMSVEAPECPVIVGFVPDGDKVNVMVKGELVTSYRYGDELTKPILWPVRTPSGIVVTRGYPFEKVEGESADHPHHTGVFFTYDKVNEDGFWNNTTSPPQIRQIGPVKMETEAGEGTLSVVLHWVGKSGKMLLEEKRDMVFRAGQDEYSIDFTIKLTAQDEKIVFGDTKEGMFAIRVAPWLKEEGGTGEYLSSNGDRREANVWGKRAKWVRLEGQKEAKTVGIAIFNHPDSVNFPTYWHARGYGLFSANPLGQLDFQKGRNAENPQPLNFTLEPGESGTFKFRMLIYEGPRSAEQLEGQFKDFSVR